MGVEGSGVDGLWLWLRGYRVVCSESRVVSVNVWDMTARPLTRPCMICGAGCGCRNRRLFKVVVLRKSGDVEGKDDWKRVRLWEGRGVDGVMGERVVG